MQLDGGRIPAEQYDALLGGLGEIHAPSSATISPVVEDAAQDIAEQHEVLSPPDHRPMWATRSKPGEHVSFASKPVAESLNAEDSYTGLVVDPSLVDVQSSVDFEDELWPEGAPLDHASRRAPEQSISLSVLSALQQAQQTSHPASAHPLHSHSTGASVLPIAPSSGLHGTRQLHGDARRFVASEISRSQRRDSRAIHLSSERLAGIDSSVSSTTLLTAEESSTDLVAPAAAPSPVAIQECPPPDNGGTIMISDVSSKLARTKQSQQAIARHKRRLKMISSGETVFGQGAKPSSFSYGADVVPGHRLSLTHALSVDAVAAAVKYNPLFSVMNAAQDWQSQQKDSTAQVRESTVFVA